MYLAVHLIFLAAISESGLISLSRGAVVESSFNTDFADPIPQKDIERLEESEINKRDAGSPSTHPPHRHVTEDTHEDTSEEMSDQDNGKVKKPSSALRNPETKFKTILSMEKNRRKRCDRTTMRPTTTASSGKK